MARELGEPRFGHPELHAAEVLESGQGRDQRIVGRGHHLSRKPQVA